MKYVTSGIKHGIPGLAIWNEYLVVEYLYDIFPLGWTDSVQRGQAVL